MQLACLAAPPDARVGRRDGLTVWFTRGGRDEASLYATHRDRLDQAFPPATLVSGLEALPVEAPSDACG